MIVTSNVMFCTYLLYVRAAYRLQNGDSDIELLRANREDWDWLSILPDPCNVLSYIPKHILKCKRAVDEPAVEERHYQVCLFCTCQRLAE